MDGALPGASVSELVAHSKPETRNLKPKAKDLRPKPFNAFRA